MRKATAICLTILATAIITSGCATRAHTNFVPPPRPWFSDYPVTLWNQIPKDAQDRIRVDDLACKKYIRSTEERAAIHNGEQ